MTTYQRESFQPPSLPTSRPSSEQSSARRSVSDDNARNGNDRDNLAASHPIYGPPLPMTTIADPDLVASTSGDSHNQRLDRVPSDGREGQQYTHSGTVLRAIVNADADHATAEKTNLVDKEYAGATSFDIPGWPNKPQKLHKINAMWVFWTLVDIIVTIIPLLFVVLAILAQRLHHTRVTSNRMGARVEEALSLTPTLFPIVFAACAGRTSRTSARYLAENGAKLGILEFFMKSQTVFGTIEGQFQLRSISIIGFLMIFIWSWSPLGSQASLRALGRGYSTTTNSAELLYFPFGTISDETVGGTALSSGTENTVMDAVNTMYNGALLAYGQISTQQDAWGNVKVPYLEDMPDYTDSNQEWMVVPNITTTPDSYTALIGVPVAGLDPSANQTFAMNYSYLVLDCPFIWTGSMIDPGLLSNLGYVWGPNGIGWAGRAPDARYLDSDGHSGWLPFFLDTNSNFTDPVTANKTPAFRNLNASHDHNIVFGSMRYASSGGISASVRNCTMRSRYIEAKVSCHSTSCAVQGMRQAPAFREQNLHLTPFDGAPVTFGNMALRLPTSFSGNSPLSGDSPSPTEFFIEGQVPFGNFSLYKGAFDESDLPIMSNLSGQAFARRLGIVLNTYINLAYGPSAFAGNLPAPSSGAFGPFNNGTDPNRPYFQVGPFYAQNTTATISQLHEIYVCNFVWLTLLFISTLLLFIVTMLGTVLKHICSGPDVFGYVASMTLNNEYFQLPTAGTVLDGMDRARLLKDLECRLGDVAGGPIGRVAFAAEDAPYAIRPVSKLRRDIQYI